MKLRGPLAAALAAVLLAAAPRPAPLTAYSAPAALRPAGASPTDPLDAVLPDGRIAAPIGASAFVGTNPFGVAVSPDGRYAIVANAEQDAANPSTPPAQAADLVAGYSLTVVDAKTMRVASTYHAAGVAFSGSVVAMRDPQDAARTIVFASDGPHDVVRIFDLEDDGTLQPEAATIATPAHGFPSTIEVAPSGLRAYVTNELNGTVTAIDLSARSALASAGVGFSPHGIALAGSRLFVGNEGLARYSALANPAELPAFADVAADEDAASSLSVLTLDASGNLTSGSGVVRMDPAPDGIATIGGAHPNAVVVRRDGAFAYVSLAGVDRVATVALKGTPHVVGGLDLRFFVDSPYGTQPGGEALSNDGKRLYVALTGLNAVAVLDSRTPATLHRLGLIPTGAFPSALALSPDGRYLYVTSANGVDGWGELQRVDLKHLPLMKATLSALRYNRTASVARPNAVVPPLGSDAKSNVIDRVVTISIGAGTFDAFLGDLGRGNGDPTLAGDGGTVTPNLHALAQSYAIADNFYANDLSDDINRLYALGGVDTRYTQRTLATNRARSPLDAHGQDPENYPREGYVFNALARANLSFRDYGGLVNLSGYSPAVPARRRRSNDTDGLGGLYRLDVPGLAALDTHVDEAYAGWNPDISDVSRANEFVRDMGALVDAGQQPAYTYVWLPSAGGTAAASDADRALGTIVQFLSHTPHWSSTAVFIVSDGVGGSRDHVNVARTFALVVSPLAKAQYVGHLHLSSASVVKTEEELLGLHPLGLSDFLATDMADFFGEVPYPNTYQALP